MPSSHQDDTSQRDDKQSTMSKSYKSKRSSASSSSMVVIQARARAEAAKARASFANKEIELKTESARLQATLEAMQEEKQMKAALAEVEILEAGLLEDDLESQKSPLRPVPLQQQLQRTADYVRDQASVKSIPQPHTLDEEGAVFQPLPVSSQMPPKPGAGCHSPHLHTPPSYLPQHAATPQQQWHGIQHSGHGFQFEGPQTGPAQTQQHYGHNPQSQQRRQPTAYQLDYSPHMHAGQGVQTTALDLVKCMARSQLITTGLTTFDDKPENYWAWKSSFQSAISGLDLSPGEELDVLIKWLGKQSSEHARRIKAANIRDSSRGLIMIWERLEETYGSPEAIEHALFTRLENFGKVSFKDSHKLRDLADLLIEVEAAKSDALLPGLSYLDTSRGVRPIVEKLPFSMQEKWKSVGSKYKLQHNIPFPPFRVFVDFIHTEARMQTDPSFNTTSFQSTPVRRERSVPTPVAVHKTQASPAERRDHKRDVDLTKHCPIHDKPHALKKCKAFRERSYEDRKQFLRERSICFRCCSSTSHFAKDCQVDIQCKECKSTHHISALHPSQAPSRSRSDLPASENGGESDEPSADEVSPNCTEVCGDGVSRRACSKICLVKVFPEGRSEQWKPMYAILDDQSNRSLARTEFFKLFDIVGDAQPYTLKTCAGLKQTAGRRARGFIVESVDSAIRLPLPTLLECNQVPNNRSEIPTSNAALHHRHLKRIAGEIPPLNPQAKILLLLGRDILRVHKVREQINGPDDAPFAQRLDLGWVIVGDVCLRGAHRPSQVNAFNTSILENGRPTYLTPCTSKVQVKENINHLPHSANLTTRCSLMGTREGIGQSVFQRSASDHQLAPSMEDLSFLQLMDDECYQDSSNSWVAPLPFRSPRQRLPNNRDYAYQRLSSLLRTLEKRPKMKSQYLEFMDKLFANQHAEVAPPLSEGQECWFLPSFGVYHPRKPEQIRVVFDSSAPFEGVSLNDVLLTGPDLNNSLLGVLLRFRKEPVAVTADIQHMFHCFVVREDHRDYLRFLWYRNNDPRNDIIEYRMRVHVFGNSPSPAVAIYGLRRAAKQGEAEFGSDTRQYVERHFYVDDGLKSFSTEAEAICVIKRAQKMLAASNLRLHKITSNRPAVLEAFPPEDRAKEIKDLDPLIDDLPLQRSLGVSWNIAKDTFTFQTSNDEKPYTRRGVLSVVNSLYDPLGFLAPVTIRGRLLLRELSGQARDWDLPLPDDIEGKWTMWKTSLLDLQELQIPRPYSSFPLSEARNKELFIFSDASFQAISAVAYLRLTAEDGKSEVSFVFGKARLAPRPEITIPRLELCGAVLAVEIAELLVEEMDLMFDHITYYTDSKVVLGYIHNQTRRFHVYVNNRVQRIRQSSSPDQWRYVPTEHNPADHGSRSVAATSLSTTTWLSGPAFLQNTSLYPSEQQEAFDLVDPLSDSDIRPLITASGADIAKNLISTKRFERFSAWGTLITSVARLIHIARSFVQHLPDDACRGWHFCHTGPTEEELEKAKILVIKNVQHECFSKELNCIAKGQSLPSQSSLRKLCPVVDHSGLLRVGGRIMQSKLGIEETNPIIIPGRHHLSTLLVRRYHESVKHQGRHFTEGAIRAGGFWITGAKRCIARFLFSCVTCRKLRGKTEHQQMADLPAERLQAAPPFTYVGVDIFGPWEAVSRRTRGGHACSRRWAALFCCMCTRAVHIEIIESMSASSFINALRRFFAIRGPAKQIHSDRGTNFVGACHELSMDVSNSSSASVDRYLQEQQCKWVFNPPHSSHMGGTWERMVGVARRILDCMLLQNRSSHLTHEVLTTFMAEVTAVINSRPLIPVSSDPEAPVILSPAVLLTQKTGTPPPPPGEFGRVELLKEEWKRVQSLAETFWSRWRREYLNTLQCRRKWQDNRPNLKEGDIVLMKDNQAKRNEWPMAIITKVSPSQDGKVRKVDVRVFKDGARKVFSRPITEVVLLLSPEDSG
ncbi:uncharacterized protein LOC143527737 [Brachyhypopomus gauderio]|uniref:uncharacterized protein LOC143527737 n=1 Tax=Brachyhypopomus gauderio TaxID=698409 RepID=UPI00404281BB